MMLRQQQLFRTAADIVVRAWSGFEEVAAVAVIGAVARALCKEVPRFRDFRRAGIEVWHECKDLDLAPWLDSQHRLLEIRRAASLALAQAREIDPHFGVSGFQLDMFLFEPGSDLYLGRLCNFSVCPKKNKFECVEPGCGATPFNRVIAEFQPDPNLLATIAWSTLYRRGEGMSRSAMDFPRPGEPEPEAGGPKVVN